MPVHPLRLARATAEAELVSALAALPDTLGLEREFSPEALAEAEAAAEKTPLPKTDRTGIPFLTIDPEGSTDLDQALALERGAEGLVVHYAIADLPAFVTPGGAIDRTARERGVTIYAADGRIPLHPVAISEHAASLLPNEVRGAFVWTFRLDARGEVVETSLERARVRSRRQLSYEQADAELAAGAGESIETLRLLLELGELRLALEAERGGASLLTPEILVAHDGERYTLERRALHAIERANAQLSLMTGMAAAQIMLDGGVGILRTMPPADEESVEHFRRQTRALGRPWLAERAYGDYLRELDGEQPRDLAILHAASALFRGASYTAFDGTEPEESIQAAIAAPYTHVTAPLRRLVDRFSLLVCEALVRGERPPAWVLEALPELSGIMGRAASAAGRLDRLTLDLVEAAVLTPRVGEEFDAVVVRANGSGARIQLADPDVEAEFAGDVEPGESLRVRLTRADVATGTLEFTRA